MAAKTYKILIDGKWIDSKSGKTFEDRNPADPSELLGRFQQGNKEDAYAAVAAAKKAYPGWSAYPAPRRGEILREIARILQERKEDLARLMVTEMGKVIAEARGDVQEAIDIAEYMAGEGRRLFGHTTPSELNDKAAWTIRRPVGIAGLITPWNFPIAIPAWKIMPALIAGCTIVLKPSSDTPLCALRLVEICEEAGLPPGVINFITGPGSVVGEAIATHPDIRAVSFTGHKDTGKRILEIAGLKRVGLELGSKNAIIVMDDADLDLAVEGIIFGAFGTTGQRCTACSRLIVHKNVRKRLIAKLLKQVKKLTLGNGLLSSTDIGPLINEQAQKKVLQYISLGKQEGATVRYGGKAAAKKGWFVPPTIFTDVKPDMRIAQEEIFGPVLAVIDINSLDEAITVCNNTVYGLSSAIYTNDINKAFKAVEKIEAGLTYINSSTIGSEAHLPFGGVKQTGNGSREAGIHGIDEFTEIKTVYVDYSGKLQKAQIEVASFKRKKKK